jgi:hypothetical protein
MIDTKKILLRSWHILWAYRVLWIFGFLLALASGNNQINNNYRSDNNNNNPPSSVQAPSWEDLQGDTFAEKMNDAFAKLGLEIQKLQERYPVEFRMVIAAAVTGFVVLVLLGIVIGVLRYVATTAAIRMVNEYEQSGVKVGFRQGWKYGWSRAAWRAFWVNVLVRLPLLVLFVVLGLIGWWIFSAFMNGEEWTIISSLIAGIGLAFLFIFATAILMAVLYVLRDLAWRLVALEDAKVIESLRAAWALVRRQWKSVGPMWLVMIGINIIWSIAFVVLIVPLLIVSLVTAIGGLVVAILPTLLTAGIVSLLSAPDYWPWIFAAIIGAPIFFIITFSPVLLVNGWHEIYQSSVWTLTYRELKALETIKPEAVEPAPAPSQPTA